jgi:phospholipid/cholesterol/gamma-HCH transport system substrate-binding protein
LPVRTGRLSWARLLTVAALGAASVFCLWLLLSSGGKYTVTAEVADAGQLVTGNEVQVGGVPIGSVSELNLRDDHVAELVLELDEDIAPLHEGTTATIRNPSLTSVAGRYVSLVPGPNDAPEIPDGGTIETEDTTEIVDLDQLLNSLDPRTVASLSQVVRGSATASRGRGDELAAAIESLNPALSRSALTLGELARDQRSLERLVARTSDVVETLATRRAEISTGTSAAAEALNAIADEREALASTLSAAPPALSTATPTLASVRDLLADLDPALGEARPVARGLSRLLPKLNPASASLRAQLPAVQHLVRSPEPDDDATDFLLRLPDLGGQGVPLLGDLTGVTGGARPILQELRPYVPELTSGIVAGFGGSSGGYYDANGHYARIAFLGGPFSVAGAPKLVPNIGSLKSGAAERCPGSATYPAADGTNPFIDTGVECDGSLMRSQP